jgi:hypothetical protein
MMMGEDNIVKLVRSELAAGRNIAVYGWARKEHNGQTLNLEALKRVRFYEQVPRELPKNVNVHLSTTKPENTFRDRLKREGVRPVILRTSMIKRILMRVQGSIRVTPKLNESAVGAESLVPPAVANSAAQTLSPTTPTTSIEATPMPEKEETVAGESSIPSIEGMPNEPDANGIAFAIEFCDASEDWDGYFMPRTEVNKLLRKHFGETARATGHKQYLVGLAQEGGVRASMYAPSEHARTIAGRPAAVAEPEPELNEQEFLATQPSSSPERARWLIDNQSTLAKLQKLHLDRAEFFAEKLASAKNAAKLLKALESF